MSMTAPEGFAYCGCPKCGRVFTVISSASSDMPWCTHHDMLVVWRAGGEDWTRCVPVRVVGEAEAKRIALEVLAHADGGCSTCVAAICADMAALYPEFPWLQWVLDEEERRWARDEEEDGRLAAGDTPEGR